jgi:D-alanyl-D-alanine carboxypeptidase
MWLMTIWQRAPLGFALLTTLLAPTLAAAAADPALESLLARRAEAFVAAMNTPGTAGLEAFVTEHEESRLAREGKTAAVAGRLDELRGTSGRVDAHRHKVVSDGRVLFVYVRWSATGAWQNFQFRVLADDGHRLQLVFVAIAVEPADPPDAPIDTPEARAWLDAFRGRLAEQQPFGGVLLVRRGDRDVYVVAAGVADAGTGRRVDRGSRFGMASGSKMFTAIAILQLAQAGRLRLDDPLSRHLPDFPDRDFAARATIHQLLTHTAGAGNYWDDAYEAAWDTLTTTAQMLPHVLRHLGETPHGTYSYSNSGFILLGLVVEATSGLGYHDYVARHILAPAGMTATGYPSREEPGARDALPYLPEMEAGAVKPGSYRPVTLGARGSAAGGAATTIDDLLRFATALKDDTLLDAMHRALLSARHIRMAESDAQWYGYGTIVEERDGVVSFGHGGTAPGTQFEFRLYPALDTVMIVMSNYDTIAPDELRRALDGLVRNGARSGDR